MKKISLGITLAILLLTLPQIVSTSPGSGGVYVFLGWWGLDDFGFTGWHDPGTETVGDYGSGDGEFDHPRGVAVDSDGNVYVADSWNDRIQKFDSSGNHLATLGSYGTGNGQFNTPWGIAVDSDGNVYVADTLNHRIQKFDSSGGFLGWWGRDYVNYTGWHGPDTEERGRSGSGEGQFIQPRGIAVDSGGNVYVADSFKHRIQKFNSVGVFDLMWGSIGTSGNLQFYFPSDVAVDSSGNVYVADSWNDRIQKFDSSGIYLATLGSYGDGDGQFNTPWGVAVDSDGNVYVADTSNHRIQKFDLSGGFLGWWGFDDFGFTEWHDSGTGTIGIDGWEDGQFYFPYDMAIDSDGNIYVADTSNNRIQKFGPVPPLGVTSPNGGETLLANTTHEITWEPGVDAVYVRIDYSVDNGVVWKVITESTENNGSYNWTVPCDLSADCLVWISDSLDDDPYDVSDDVFTIKSETKPVITLNGLSDMVLECGIETYTEDDATAVDGCGNEVQVDIGGDTVDTSTCGTYEITYDAKDASGLAADTKTRTVIVRDTTPPDPYEKPLPSVSGECSVEISIIPTATDICSGSINGIPSDPLVPTGEGTYICTKQGTHTVTWTYTDDKGNVATQPQTITVDDTTLPVPDATELETVEGECSAKISVKPKATDNCSGVIVGETEDPVEYDEPGTYTVTWKYDDGNGNVKEQTQTVNVVDVTPPTIHLSDSTCVDVKKWVMANMLTVSATDNCSSDVELTIDKVEILNKRGRRVWGRGVYRVVGNDIYVFPRGRDWSVRVTATAADAKGNTKTDSIHKSLLRCNRWSGKMAKIIRLLYILLWRSHHCW